MSEIAENIKAYDQEAEEQSALASQLYQLSGTLKTIGDLSEQTQQEKIGRAHV